jgi:hypothetical protein
MVAKYVDYSAESYGLFLALNTDSNISVDFIDEDALVGVDVTVILTPPCIFCVF